MDSDTSQANSQLLKAPPEQPTQDLPTPLQTQPSTFRPIQPALQPQLARPHYVQTASQGFPYQLPFNQSPYGYPSLQSAQYVPERLSQQPVVPHLNQPKKRGRPSKSQLPSSACIDPRTLPSFQNVLQPGIPISSPTVQPAFGMSSTQSIEPTPVPSQTLLPRSGDTVSGLPAAKRICLVSRGGKRADGEDDLDLIENSENVSPESKAVQEEMKEPNKEKRIREDFSSEEVKALLCVMQDEGENLLDSKGRSTAKAIWEDQIFPIYKNRCNSDGVLCRRTAQQLSEKWKKIKAKYSDRRQKRSTTGHGKLEDWDIEEQLDQIFARSQKYNPSFDINPTSDAPDRKRSKSSAARKDVVEAINAQTEKLMKLEERKIELWKEESAKKIELWKEESEKKRELFKNGLEMVWKMFETVMNGAGKLEQVEKGA